MTISAFISSVSVSALPGAQTLWSVARSHGAVSAADRARRPAEEA